MAKATLQLPNGTIVTLDGTPDEVKHLLELYGGQGKTSPPPSKTRRTSTKKKSATKKGAGKETEAKPNLTEIVNLVKDCDEAEAMETQILDRTSLVDRTLLPLYIVHKHLDNGFGLTSGEISKINTDLGIPVAQPSASRTLSGTASRYVIGDIVKVKGRAVRYKLSRRGVTYLKKVIAGTDDGG